MISDKIINILVFYAKHEENNITKLNEFRE